MMSEKKKSIWLTEGKHTLLKLEAIKHDNTIEEELDTILYAHLVENEV